MTAATIATIPKTQLQPPVGPSVDSLCHWCFTTTNLSYRFPISKTSATALCGLLVWIYIYIYIIYVYVYIYTCNYIYMKLATGAIWCLKDRDIIPEKPSPGGFAPHHAGFTAVLPPVDGRTPAPVDRWFIPLFIGFQASKVVQDFFHPPHVSFCCTLMSVAYVNSNIVKVHVTVANKRSPSFTGS